MIDLILEPMNYLFMRKALIASLLISMTCSSLGVHVVHRRMAFLGDAIAHTTLPGLVIAWLNRWSLFFGALVAAVLTAVGIGWISRRERIREDTAIGVLFSGMFALGVVLISRTKSYRDFSHMLFGNVLGVSNESLVGILIVTLIVFVGLGLLSKELMLTAVDPLHAEVIGLSAEKTRSILLVLMALTIVTAIQAVGVVLTSAMLVTPAATAVILTSRLRRQMLLSVVLSSFASVSGLYSSYYFGISAGGAIVLVCTGCFCCTFLIQSVLRRRVH
ncbi:MAG: metal ABC transporter permease [Planctomyces sp.]|nr:metal ABC transporter permease [Planctomyces sp.]